MKTLIVDERNAERNHLVVSLSKYGTCFVTETCADAYTLLESAMKENVPFTIICLELNVAGQDGIKRIRQIEQKWNVIEEYRITIIAMTTCNDLKIPNLAFQNGADYYLVKPVNLSKLEERLKQKHLIG